MNNLHILITWLFPDRRPEWEKAREREFIAAVNDLKTLSVSDRGRLSIDPEELREQIIASREQLKHLVHKPGLPNGPFKAAADLLMKQGALPAVDAPVGALDCIEVVAWRLLTSGAAMRYVCLQSTSTSRYSVAMASLFSGDMDSLPPWIDVSVNKQFASYLQNADLHWYRTVSEAMDAWEAKS